MHKRISLEIYESRNKHWVMRQVSVSCCVLKDMGVEWLLLLYHHYALFLGVTSYRLKSGIYRQGWLTRSYTLLLNVCELLSLPWGFYLSAIYVKEVIWFPRLISYTTYVLYSASYLAIAYTLLSRGRRDKALLEVQRIVRRLKRQKTQDVILAEHLDGSLCSLFYIKLGIVIFLAVCSMTSCFRLPPNQSDWSVMICEFILSNSMNIPLVATYRYFLALWDIAYCYQYINGKFEILMKCAQARYPTKVELKEFHRLWTLHALLGRCTLKIHQVYGWLMLAARFENLVFSVINGYWGILFYKTHKSPFYVLFFGAANYYMRLIDFYLLNSMCDLTIQLQSYAHHTISEGYWFKELNAYLLYASTSKMKLWVCGLYKVNRKCWYRMFGSILNYSILLLQFHLLMKSK